MAYGLVGISGGVTLGASNAAVTPAYGTGQSRTAPNLLLCWVAGFSTTTLPTTPANWSVATQIQGTSCSATIFYKIATGSDAAPTIAAATGTRWAVLVNEYSGNAAASPFDKPASGAATTSPIVATASDTDAASGELMIACGTMLYSVAGAKTIAHTMNNGATSTDLTNSATSTTLHYDFGYGVTTGNGSADSDSLAFTTTNITGAALAVASFKLPAVIAAPTSDTSLTSDSVTRALTASRTTADTTASSDSTTRALSSPRAPTDASLSSDSATRGLVESRSLSDTSTTTDTTTRLVAFTRTATDASLTTDATTVGRSFPRSLTDSSLTSDSTTRGLRFTRTTGDTSVMVDSASSIGPVSRSASDVSLTSDTTISSIVRVIPTFLGLAGVTRPTGRDGLTRPTELIGTVAPLSARTGATSPRQRTALTSPTRGG